ncbi:23S rRNA (adenine(2030)-N(6))-methyltransferase RlmJ [Pasteurellaceae bacterium HPA106]|uniref:23S rRNA (adenine(2030)-N(6))-methyltransferase RlmJ n=1 Tax=Spirabiliibacterium pneumoniae TaxID=221400 RepID=UPI001AADAD23|nr:23S rRNA (adenine(2030)-N(6))-methyltransferase RlmJ [Spirabiliibacterium pneumoniae]MBE2895770.1 23S rRNA (adenine(2030)-N(6))-methyltransferase RlmJ [Spirabiliibacterium pneumoniae]
MLSYRHSFHAGNHADVLKHTVLVAILRALQQKEKGFFYLDTHAGAGRYSLQSKESEKTAEYLAGVAPLWDAPGLPAVVADYLKQVKATNGDGQLRYYPGSPLIAANLLRSQDSALLCELHPSDFPLLRRAVQPFTNMKCLRGDGYQQLKAALPPPTRRGVILMDPSYELKSDYEQVVTALCEGYKRFATGTYAIWYPVVLRTHIKRMVRALAQTGIKKILQIELAVRPDSTQRGMTASGMIVVNPPWTLEAQMREALPFLAQTLVNEGTGSWQLEWIVGEN